MENLENEEKADITLSFFIPQKVAAFVESYTPAVNEQDAEDIFTDAKLRQYFQSYSRPTGDPLLLYVEELEKYGFRFHTSIMGEPAIFVRYK